MTYFFCNVTLVGHKARAEKRGIHTIGLRLKPVSGAECRRLVLRPTSTQKDTLLLSSESKAPMVRRPEGIQGRLPWQCTGQGAPWKSSLVSFPRYQSSPLPLSPPSFRISRPTDFSLGEPSFLHLFLRPVFLDAYTVTLIPSLVIFLLSSSYSYTLNPTPFLSSVYIPRVDAVFTSFCNLFLLRGDRKIH